MKSGKPDLQLSLRDEAILEHVRRYRISTREFLQREFFPEAGASAVAKVVTRLTDADYLRSYALEPGFHYVVLGRRGARRFDIDGRACRRFTEQSLPLAYGVAAYCLARKFHKLTGREFRAAFPELTGVGAHDGLYFRALEENGLLRLTLPLLDRGNSPRTVLRKLKRLITQRLEQPGFQRLIHDGRFCITILTAWPVKQRYLSAVVRMKVRGPVHVRVDCVPELQRLLPRM